MLLFWDRVAGLFSVEGSSVFPMSKRNQITFVDTHGQLPPLWSRRVAFFANLLALFFGNEQQTQALVDEVGEIDSYGGRLIPIINLLFRGEDNMLVLEREPDEILCRYLRDDLGLSLPRMQVMQHRDYIALGEYLKSGKETEAIHHLETLSQHGAEWLDGYVTDEILSNIATHLKCQTISSSAASQDGNNKFLLHQYQVQQGLPAFDTELVSSAAEMARCAQSLSEKGYSSAVLRSQIGASGIGMLRLENLEAPDAFPDIPDHFFYEGPCLLQGWMEKGILGIENVRSPSTQLFLNETHVYAYDMTEQILSSESIHQGNESPPPYMHQLPGLREETMRQAESAGNWLHQTGYRGTASIDWLVVERAGQTAPDVYLCEINARVTGATYPSLLARHFHPDGAWLLRNLRLAHPISTEKLLALFKQPGHLFQPEKQSGILPLNLNFGKDNLVHKGQFLCIAESTDECHQLLKLVEHDLPIQWDTDRD